MKKQMKSSRYTNIDIDKKIQKDVDFNDIVKKVVKTFKTR